MEPRHNDYKALLVMINESQARRLEEFLDSIKFYFYTVEHKVERVVSEKIRHKNSLLWPGSDCLFSMLVPDRRLETLLSQLKAFRMALPEGVIMSAVVSPIVGLVPSFYKEDIPYDKELTEELKKKFVR